MKVAFCFLVYDQIYNLDLWNHFFSEIPSNQYSIYIHSKNKFKYQPLFEKIIFIRMQLLLIGEI